MTHFNTASSALADLSASLEDAAPLPTEDALVQLGRALMTELVDVISDTALEDYQTTLGEALIGAFHSAAGRIERLRRQEGELQKVYPDFCWQEEMRREDFGRLILAGVEPRTAYETVHGRELMEKAMRYAAGRTRRQRGAAGRGDGHRSARLL